MQMIDSREFAEWKAYYLEERFGDDWQQAGTIAAAATNVMLGKGVTPTQPSDFIPGRHQDHRGQTAGQMEMVARSAIASHNQVTED